MARKLNALYVYENVGEERFVLEFVQVFDCFELKFFNVKAIFGRRERRGRLIMRTLS
jgi:hypothetical protein